MKIVCVIIAGGRSIRMGTEKAVATLREKPILSHIVERVVPQVASIVINANGEAGRFSEFELPVIADRRTDIGTPLAGLHTALCFARQAGFDAVLTVPSDTPFLPHDLVSRLGHVASPAALAASRGQDHFLTGLWSHHLLEKLERAIDVDRLVRVKDWASYCGAARIVWSELPYDPFFNINTPQDLADATRIAAEFMP